MTLFDTLNRLSYADPVIGVPMIGFCSPEIRRTSAIERFFYVCQHDTLFYGRVMWGAVRLAGTWFRSANPHGSVRPFCSGRGVSPQPGVSS